MTNYINLDKRYVITQPYHNFNDGLVKPPLKLRYERVITSQMWYGCTYLSMSQIYLNRVTPSQGYNFERTPWE